MHAIFTNWTTSLRDKGLRLVAEDDDDEALLRMIMEVFAIGGTITVETADDSIEVEFNGSYADEESQ